MITRVVGVAVTVVVIVILNCMKHVSPFLSHHLLGDDVGLLCRWKREMMRYVNGCELKVNVAEFMQYVYIS